MSCSRIYNDYDGIQHDYTKKRGLVWQQVFLTPVAPVEWSDREKLWNAVEENEKAKDSRLAREFVAALPVELDRDKWISLLTGFIQTQFVADGMCADVAIHDTDGHNPHAHIMLTIRPLNENGTWQHKTEKEYLCIRNGEERGFTASEFKAAQADGWEEQYPYKVGRKKVYMPPSKAEAQGYERASKHPKSTKYGRQNPISKRWNSDEQLALWREAWASAVNRQLELVGAEERIDHRSHAERGIDERPTIHEGVTARTMEANGIISDRCELNRQIRAENKVLRELKVTIAKLMDSIKNGVSQIAAALEAIRERLIIADYGVRDTGSQISNMQNRFRYYAPLRREYDSTKNALREKVAERKTLVSEKKALSPIHILQHRDLTARITTLTEDIEELQSRRKQLLVHCRCADDGEIKALDRRLAQMQKACTHLQEQQRKFQAQRRDGVAQYEAVFEQIKAEDERSVDDERRTIRPASWERVEAKLQEIYGERFDPDVLENSEKAVNMELHLSRRVRAHCNEMQRQRRQQQPERREKRGQQWER